MDMKEKKVEDCSSPEHEWCDPINESGILYRTQYLVLSRTLLEAMPKEWQHRFIGIMDEISDEFDFMSKDWIIPNYNVRCKDDNGRYMSDPWGKYRYPNKEMIDSVRIKKN